MTMIQSAVGAECNVMRMQCLYKARPFVSFIFVPGFRHKTLSHIVIRLTCNRGQRRYSDTIRTRTKNAIVLYLPI